ncbi:MAG: DHH family phosphoesterase [Bacilli bacterium]|nr:DHH family phosphoesterase [Bacilli bacterium]
MKRTYRRIRIYFTIFAVAELLAITFLSLFYHFNWFNFQDVFTGLNALAAVLVVIAVNIIALGFTIMHLYYLRQKSDLHAAELIGSDIQEAYNFGMIGLAIVDDEDTVLWTNELFHSRGIKILDENIFAWSPRLKELKNAAPNFMVRINHNSRCYEVKYLKEAKLYIFKDITELESATTYAKEKAPVVGLIIIDNLSDVADSSDDSNDTISKIRNEIFEYAKAHRLLLRRFRNDAYFAVCDFTALESMLKDQFSIIENVRKIGAKEVTPPTLSIGFAYDFPDVNKLNEMANDAIDIAMSRGGDQAVVSRYGAELAFYGGRTEASETRNKVKVRVLADSLIASIKLAKSVLVLGHADADMDALGSCLGIKAMCDHLEKPCRIVYDPKMIERKARAAFINSFTREEINKMIIPPKEAADKVKSTTLVILVDCHRPSLSLAPKLLDKADKIVVIDHHRRSKEFVEDPVFTYIEPSASSASELISELIHYASLNPHIKIPPAFATIMLSGIFLDSNFFKTKTTGIRTFEASMLLKEFGADNAQADDFLKDEFEEYSLITQIASTLKTPHVGVVYCMASEEDIVEPATLAKVANQCMQMKGVNAAFVIGKVNEDESRISCRSDGTINVQLLAEKMGGGGHFSAGAVPLKNKSIHEGEVLLLEILRDYLKQATATVVKGEK